MSSRTRWTEKIGFMQISIKVISKAIKAFGMRTNKEGLTGKVWRPFGDLESFRCSASTRYKALVCEKKALP